MVVVSFSASYFGIPCDWIESQGCRKVYQMQNLISSNLFFLFITQHDRVRVIFQYALKILPKEECEVSVDYAYACSQRSCFAVDTF